jgi:hypothetical protein
MSSASAIFWLYPINNGMDAPYLKKLILEGHYRPGAGRWKPMCSAALPHCVSSMDKAGDLYVFDIGGNKYRLIAFLHAAHQLAYIKHVLTHSEYDKGAWKK